MRAGSTSVGGGFLGRAALPKPRPFVGSWDSLIAYNGSSLPHAIIAQLCRPVEENHIMAETSVGDGVRSAVEDAIERGQVPGVAVAVARGKRPTEYLIVGTDALGRPLVRDTLFPVASITKLATALAVLRLVDSGALALDDSLDQHLPSAAAAEPGVTIRKLLCHTSGLPLDVSASSAPYIRGLDWPTLATASLLTS